MNRGTVLSSEESDKLFPTLESINLEIDELINCGWKSSENTYKVNKNNFRGFIRCTSPLCSGGGVSITDILSEAIHNKNTTISVGKHCDSIETNGRQCLQYFRVEGDLKYKSTDLK